MIFVKRLLLTTLLAVGFAMPVVNPVAASEDRVYFSWGGEPRVPECLDNSVQSAVSARVARAYSGYYDGRVIVGIDRIVETAYELGTPSPLARRFCEGRATLSDGTETYVFYKVVEHAGFVGIRWNVEACLSGLDRWHVYDAYCRTVRPGRS